MSEIQPKKKKRPKSYYIKSAKKRKQNDKDQLCLQPGMKGFIVTCNNKEKDCIREAYNLLNEFADKLYGPEIPSIDSKSTEDDIEAALEKELDSLKSLSDEPRFQEVKSKAKNCLFIKTKVETPRELMQSILSEIEQQQRQRTRFLLRMIPVDVTCKAYLDDILSASRILFENYFKNERVKETYLIILKVRYNNDIKKSDIIHKLISQFQSINEDVKAELKNPNVVFNIDIICTICCLSILPNYFHYKKYNLVELASNVKKQIENNPPIITDTSCKQTDVNSINPGDGETK